MNPVAIADSVAHMAGPVPACPTCAAQAHIERGTCLGCLLRSGLDETLTSGGEDFDQVLSAIEVRDTEWRLGNYHIFEEIGRGGMGVIYRARQRHSKRIVALKRVLGYHGDSHETLERFRREAEAAASLDHPNILPIYEVGEADGLPFFTMKYATAGTLQDRASALRDNPRECVRLLAKVTRAVAYAHREGLLHRDLKPGNVLLDGRGEPMVSDFGLAKWIDANSDLTRSLAIFGTPGFIAPEQAEGDRNALTPAADVYSLGAILFDLLSGRPPFLGEHAIAVIRQAAEKPAPKLRSLVRQADRDLETICAKCLERDPRARYPSAAELAEDLERWLEGRAIIARPVSAPVRVWRWSRRNRGLALTLAIFLIVGGALGTAQFRSHLVERRALAGMHSIDVARLLNLETAGTDHDLTSALAEALQKELSRHGPSRVDFSPGETPGAVGARTILRGTVRRVGGNLRLALRLHAADNRLLYRRLIEVADEKAGAVIAAKLIGSDLYRLLDAPTLIGKESVETDPGWQDANARELLLAAKAVYERRSVLDHDRAIGMTKEAVEMQPESAVAYSQLAQVQSGRAFLTGDRSYLRAAEVSAEKAISLAPGLANTHLAMAVVRFRQGRFRESLDATFRAWELSDHDDPRLANRASDSLRKLGRPDLAADWLRFGLGKESRPGWNEFALGDCLTELGADEEAAKAYRRFSSLFPELPEGWMGLCRLALLRRDFATAQRIAAENWARYPEFVFSQQMAAQTEFFARNFAAAEKHYAELAAREPDGGGTFYGAISYRSALGRILLEKGETEEGERLLRQALAEEEEAARQTPSHTGVLYRLAAIRSSLGEVEPALQTLREAVASGWLDYRSMSLDPRFDAIRADERFAALVRGLEEKIAALREGKPPEGELVQLERHSYAKTMERTE